MVYYFYTKCIKLDKERKNVAKKIVYTKRSNVLLKEILSNFSISNAYLFSSNIWFRQSFQGKKRETRIDRMRKRDREATERIEEWGRERRRRGEESL